MKYIALILILLLSSNVHSRNNYYEGHRAHDQYGFECQMTITQAYDVLYQKFSNEVIAHKPCYEIKDLPPNTKEFFKVTRKRVALLNAPAFFGDTMKVIAFASCGEIFPLVGTHTDYKICDPFDPICQDCGVWAETYINGTMVYLKIDEVGGHFAEIYKIEPAVQIQKEKKGFLAVVWEWIKGLLGLAFVFMFIGIIWNEISESDSSSSSSSGGGTSSTISTYSSSTYKSSDSYLPRWVKCPDCNGEAAHVFSRDCGDGVCSKCHGKGFYVTASDIAENIATGNFNHTTPCYKCDESGICQTCEGDGKVKG